MKNFFYSLICFLCFSAALSAQTAASDQLNITDMQKAKYEQIQQTHKAQMEGIADLQKSNVEKYYAKRTEIFQATDNKMKTLMDDKQWAVYERLRNQRNSLFKLQEKQIKK